MPHFFERIFDKLILYFNFLNRSNSHSNKVSRGQSFSGSIQQAGGNITNITNVGNNGLTLYPKPLIDILESFGSSGGPDGNFIAFAVRNNGKETALDVEAEFVADRVNSSGKFLMSHSLLPNGASRMRNYRYTDTDFFRRKLSNPKIVFFYKSIDGTVLTSARRIIQDKRPGDGNYNMRSGDFVV